LVVAVDIGRFIMRRFSLILSVVAVMALGITAHGAQLVTVAQEATPSADMEMEGATFLPLGFASGVMLPSPADLFLARFSLDPGVSFPLESSDPTGTMVVVESGAFSIRVEEMAWTITRGAVLSAAMESAEEDADWASAQEEVTMGEEAVLQAGDVAWVPGSVSGEVRNDGQERAEGLLFLVGPPEAMMAEATPAP
jgi:quercetin dioxygenase-like cupin family protein